MIQKLRVAWHNFLYELRSGPSKKASERRREVRETLSDSSVKIDGKAYPVQNWSKSACYIGPVDLDVTLGRRLDASFEISIAGERLEFACRIGVLRVDNDVDCFAANYLDLGKEVRREVEKHFKELEHVPTK